MRKTIAFVLITLLISGSACMAQKGFEKGDKLLNIGLGINSYYDGGFPVGASFEVGITDAISVGGGVDYLSNKYNYAYDYSYKFTALYAGVRGSYHVNELLNLSTDKIDLYGGAAVGFRSFSWNDDFESFGSYGSGVYFGAFVGGKYYFNKKVGVFSELGAIGSTNVRVGVAFKF